MVADGRPGEIRPSARARRPFRNRRSGTARRSRPGAKRRSRNSQRRWKQHSISNDKHGLAISRRDVPELCDRLPLSETRGRRESRVRAAPAVSCARMHKEKRTRAYRFSGGNPAFPAQWFYGLFRDLPGETSSIATVTSRINSAKLGASVGRQNHATSPYAQVTIVSRTPRVHRIPPRVRDDCDPPLSSGETGRLLVLICPTG